MGNTSSAREGVDEEQGGISQPGEESEDLMGQSPPQSPRVVAQAPLLFSPQMPMDPLQLQRHEQIHSSPSIRWMADSTVEEPGIPAMITWSHGGKEVLVEGSWDNWKTRKPLLRSGKDFILMMVLPSGFYQYRFIVDGEWRYAPDAPWTNDVTGDAHNILDLKTFVPEKSGEVPGFEAPQSPESSYNNWPLGPEDLSKEPPLLPPQLHPTRPMASSSPTGPPHVVLDHLYIQKGKSGQPVVALGKTQRFLSKYVTVILYKSLSR